MKCILLTNSSDEALIDDEDFDNLQHFPWRLQVNANGKRYVVRSRGRKEEKGAHLVKLHRIVMHAPAGKDVDHINGNGLDNRRCNLRICTRGENLRNSVKVKGCSSQYKGVYLYKNGKWAAQIKPPTGHIYLGLFVNESDAARAYDAKARELFGEFAKCNFPVPVQLRERGLIK